MVLRRLAISLLVSCACGPKVLDDDASGGDDTNDAAFARECAAGCADIEVCAPEEFALLFADVDVCAASCQERYGACVDEAQIYFACVNDASCDVVAQILVDGPMTTACGPAFAEAEQACGR